VEAQRFDNAAYLSGYVVECCLKALLEMDGMPSVKELGHDLPLIAGNALMLAYALAASRRRYGLAAAGELGDLINRWRPDSRYDREGTTPLAAASSRFTGALTAYEQIGVAMRLDGVV